MSANLGDHTCEGYRKVGVACNRKLKRGLNITGEVDNIDHDPSSRTATDSFQCTAITWLK